jgi:vacuolar-type H+-ATPase subunit C/Vma6
LRSEIDETNLLIALRLRAARGAGEITAAAAASVDRYLLAGRIRLTDLAAVATAVDGTDVLARLDETPMPAGWLDALGARVGDEELGVLADDLGVLADELHAVSTRFAVGLFHRGDPLGFDIPVAFTRAEEHEARNLRWIGRGITHGLDVDEIERRVVVIT